MNNHSPKCLCILIHGTWGQKSPFAFEGSTFTHQIEDYLSSPIKFERFEWNGRNTQRSRLKAGERLGRLIQKLGKEYPQLPLFLIAHSHGGNIARYAVRSERPRLLVRGIICMSTPFLHAKPRMFRGEVERPGIDSLPWYSVPSHLVTALGTTPLALLILGPLTAGIMQLGNVILALAFLVPIVSFIAYVYFFKKLGNNGTGNPYIDFMNWIIVSRRDLVSEYSVPNEVNTITYVISVTGDEALWWLKRLTDLSKMASVLWFIAENVFLIWQFLFLSLVVGLMCSTVIWALLDIFDLIEYLRLWMNEFPMVGVVLGSIFAGGIFISPMVLSLGLATLFISQAILRSHEFGFGEGLLANILARISVTRLPKESPCADSFLQTIKLHKFLHHSLVYTEENVIECMAKWINRRCIKK